MPGEPVLEEDACKERDENYFKLNDENGRGSVHAVKPGELQAIGQHAADQGRKKQTACLIPHGLHEPDEDECGDGETHAHQKNGWELIKRAFCHRETRPPDHGNRDGNEEIEWFHGRTRSRENHW